MLHGISILTLFQDHNMEGAGQKLKRVRERLKLTYRDIEKASQQIARRRGSPDFSIALSRLSDIENRGVVPTIYRLYSLCAIYRLDMNEVLRWYGVSVDDLPSEAMRIGLEETHPIRFIAPPNVTVPGALDREIDLGETSLLGHLVRRWGKVPLSLLDGLEPSHYTYGLVGTDDWSMSPIIPPGSLVLIDGARGKIAVGGWTNEHERPIYFLEHRTGYICGWCLLTGDRLVVQPHPASSSAPAIFRFPEEIDVIGQVVGIAMFLDGKRRRHTRGASASPKPSKATS
jgi:transcriptional regulator with XRE-family HTH domain